MKNICVFTGTRAEYGLLSHFIRLLEKNVSYDLTLVVSGTHLSNSFGYTLKEIEENYSGKLKKIKLPIDEENSIAYITSIALKKYSAFLEKNKFDLVFLLGDRYECFAMASASFLNRVPIAHIHGGETSLGAIDNSLRHSITHMSEYHFVSCKEHLDKVISLGAKKENSLIVGPMIIDNLLLANKISNSYFEYKTNFKYSEKNLLLTFHSETLSKDYGLKIFENLLIAIEQLMNNKKLKVAILATYPNADTAGSIIKKRLEEFALNKKYFSLFPSLGHDLYVHALKSFNCLIGNSSSGLIEAPLVGIPVINLGDRQKGRKSFGEVIDLSGEQKTEILSKLEEVIFANNTKKKLTDKKNLKSPSNSITSFLGRLQ